MKKFKPTLYGLAVVNHRPDATIWRVVAIDGLRMGVIDTALEDVCDQATQWHDVCLFKAPNNAQVQTVIARDAAAKLRGDIEADQLEERLSREQGW